LSADDNLTTVKTIYDAFGSGDVETILGCLADDVDWHPDASGDEAPWWPARKGKDQVSGFFQAIGESLEVTAFEPIGMAANDSDEVMVLIKWGAKSKATGREVSMHIHHYWHFKDGKVDHYHGSEDTQQTAAALAA
jgi:uncharacterized protein